MMSAATVANRRMLGFCKELAETTPVLGRLVGRRLGSSVALLLGVIVASGVPGVTVLTSKIPALDVAAVDDELNGDVAVVDVALATAISEVVDVTTVFMTVAAAVLDDEWSVVVPKAAELEASVAICEVVVAKEASKLGSGVGFFIGDGDGNGEVGMVIVGLPS